MKPQKQEAVERDIIASNIQIIHKKWPTNFKNEIPWLPIKITGPLF